MAKRNPPRRTKPDSQAGKSGSRRQSSRREKDPDARSFKKAGDGKSPRNKKKDDDQSGFASRPRSFKKSAGSAPAKGRKPGFARPRKDEDPKEKPTAFAKRSFADKRKTGSSRTKSTEHTERTFEKAPVQTQQIRLNRYIANSGVCSRREADELISMGLITVNGKSVTELGYKVNPGDEVRYENKVLRAEKPVYILLNKPKGYLTTTSDPQERNTVMHLIGNAVKERIYPVGRLDRNTTGLLLLTNDGELADKLMHPSYNVKKIYKAELDRPLTKADFQRLMEGIELEEGRAMVDDAAIISTDGKTVGLELHIGWNRVVRRIFEAMQYEVVKLDRSVYAGLDKKNLSRGQWRFLKKEEIIRLKHYK